MLQKTFYFLTMKQQDLRADNMNVRHELKELFLNKIPAFFRKHICSTAIDLTGFIIFILV